MRSGSEDTELSERLMAVHIDFSLLALRSSNSSSFIFLLVELMKALLTYH